MSKYVRNKNINLKQKLTEAKVENTLLVDLLSRVSGIWRQPVEGPSDAISKCSWCGCPTKESDEVEMHHKGCLATHILDALNSSDPISDLLERIDRLENIEKAASILVLSKNGFTLENAFKLQEAITGMKLALPTDPNMTPSGLIIPN